MSKDSPSPSPQPRRSLLGAAFGAFIIVIGAGLAIAGSNETFDLELGGFTLPEEAPGLLMLGLGCIMMFSATKRDDSEPSGGD